MGKAARGSVLGRWRRAALASSTLLVATAVAAGCTSGGAQRADGSGADSSTPGAGSTSAAPSSTAGKAAAQAAVITTSPISTEEPISPADPVRVSIANGELRTVSLLNPVGKLVKGSMSADHKSWQTAEALGYGKTYRLAATGANADGVAVSKKSTLVTVTPDNFTMPSITDVYGTTLGSGGTYGVGMIVRVHFDESVDKAAAEKSLQVTTTPNVTGGWYWSDDQNAYWRPKSYYPANTKVTVKAAVYGKKLGHGLYGQDDRAAAFTIGQKRITIANGKTHDVKVYFDGKLERTMDTSMGKGGYDPTNPSVNFWTMKGNYTVLNHENPATMSSASFGVKKGSPNYYPAFKVPWSTKVSLDGIYLHEYNETRDLQGHENVTHGCLNLTTKNAKWFYQHSRVGDVVSMVKTGGPTITFNQGGQWSMSWSAWAAGSALH